MFIVIVGCGRMGSMLAQDFSNEGHNVVIIDKCRDRLEALGNAFNGRIIEGTGIDEEILVRAGIKEADVFLAVSQEDNINIMAAQIAKNIFQVPCVIARNYKLELHSFYKKLGLHTIYPLQHNIELIKSKVLCDVGEIVGQMDDPELMCLKYEVNEKLAGMEVSTFEEKHKAKVVQLEVGGKSQYPSGQCILKKGNQMTLVVAKVYVEALKSLEVQGDRW